MTEDQYREVEAMAREVRQEVADQLHDLVLERNGLGSLDEIAHRVRRVSFVHTEMLRARGRQAQAREYGSAVEPHVRAEREARETLRASVLALAEACGSVVVGMDVEDRKRVVV